MASYAASTSIPSTTTTQHPPPPLLTRVCHGQDSGPVMAQRLIELILELAAPDGLAARAVAWATGV